MSVVVSRFPDTSDAGQLLVTMVDFSERRRYEEQLAHLADHDPLTGLGNRRLFDSELLSHLTRCQRSGPMGALLMLDLDNFKQVNDTLGHGAGDQLIISTANVIKARLRASDVVARLGGDEFAVLLPDPEASAARAVAAELVCLIRDNVTTFDGDAQRRISSSMGVVMIDRIDLSPSELLANADLTMYDAKEAGRNRFAFFDADTFNLTRTGAKLAWADRIRVALEENRFVLHAQPIINLTTNKITGAELLLRMVDDAGQLILPGRFVYIAEKLGMATLLDTWVCDRSIDILEEIQQIDPDFHIEVNLSGHSVGDPQLAANIGARIRTAAIDATKLVFEITETAAIANIDTARTFASKIRSLGCRFALDDFGAGFGSFYYLKHLPFDYIKIDGEFITNCATNPIDRHILTSIVDIARGLKQTTIAEFVSDADIFEIVRQHGVDLAQGYYISRPIPIDALISLLSLGDSPPVPVPRPREVGPALDSA